MRFLREVMVCLDDLFLFPNCENLHYIHVDNATILVRVSHRKSICMAALAHLYNVLDLFTMGSLFHGSTLIFGMWAEAHMAFSPAGEPLWKKE